MGVLSPSEQNVDDRSPRQARNLAYLQAFPERHAYLATQELPVSTRVHLDRPIHWRPAGPFYYLDLPAGLRGFLENELCCDVPMAKTRKFAGAIKNDAAFVTSVLSCFFEENLCRERIAILAP